MFALNVYSEDLLNGADCLRRPAVDWTSEVRAGSSNLINHLLIQVYLVKVTAIHSSYWTLEVDWVNLSSEQARVGQIYYYTDIPQSRQSLFRRWILT